jgi:hypothetical protein
MGCTSPHLIVHRPELEVKMHSFDEWFSRIYPEPQPSGTKDTALMGWNAAVHAAQDVLKKATGRFIDEQKYELAAIARDLREELHIIIRKRD